MQILKNAKKPVFSKNLAKIGADTAENELNFAEILPIGRRVADHPEEVPDATSFRAGSPRAPRGPSPGVNAGM